MFSTAHVWCVGYITIWRGARSHSTWLFAWDFFFIFYLRIISRPIGSLRRDIFRSSTTWLRSGSLWSFFFFFFQHRSTWSLFWSILGTRRLVNVIEKKANERRSDKSSFKRWKDSWWCLLLFVGVLERSA